MIILATGKNVSVAVKDNDLLEGTMRYYAFYNAGYYDPRNEFKPCFDGAELRRRLYNTYAAEYNALLPEANSNFDKLRTVYGSAREP